MKTKLLPCPFCGNSNEQKLLYTKEDLGFQAECRWCYARGPLFGTKQEAIESWNRTICIRPISNEIPKPKPNAVK